MSRLSFRPRPLDIHKKLPIVKSVKDLEDDETAGATRTSQLVRLTLETENEVVHSSTGRKGGTEIPTPQFVVVESYERDYSCTFVQPPSYLRGRGTRAENTEFIEYDLDDEDEDWLQEFNNEKKILSPERFESMLYKLEILDHKARERAVGLGTTIGVTMSVLQLDAAVEALQSQNTRYAVLQAVFNYWKAKRDRWQKPILRRLQPPPPVNDTNPYNVFRPREKAHRLHTRRMQRRENNVQSFEKLRQVRRNLDQAKAVMKALTKREEKKREVMECEINLQRVQIKYKHETQHGEDGFMVPGLPPLPHKSALVKRVEDEHITGQHSNLAVNSLDLANGHARIRPGSAQTPPVTDAMPMMEVADQTKREQKRNQALQPRGWISRRDPLEPVLLFTKHLDSERLAAAGIVPPSDPPIQNGATTPPYRFQGRIGRGGRIVFDRWNPLTRTPLGCDRSPFSAENLQPPPPRL
eukprot:Gb_40059 [translate_table: standard]